MRRLALIALLLAGCGGGAPAKEAARVADEPLLELDIQQGQALRVLPDGRYEFRGDVEPEVSEDGGVTLRKVPLQWRLQWTFTPEELEQLRAAIDEADDPPLDPLYTAGRQIHGRNLIWTLRTSRRTARVEVQGWPAAQPRALERLYRRLFEIHRPPGETSTWRLWTGTGATEKLVPCEPGSVPQLRGVVAALFGSDDSPRPEGADVVDPPPDDTPLAEVAYRRDGEEFERLRVYGDGRQIQVLDGQRHELDPLPGERVQALRAAIAAAGWDALPDRLC
jgi:hypothetical protein